MNLVTVKWRKGEIEYEVFTMTVTRENFWVWISIRSKGPWVHYSWCKKLYIQVSTKPWFGRKILVWLWVWTISDIRSVSLDKGGETYTVRNFLGNVYNQEGDLYEKGKRWTGISKTVTMEEKLRGGCDRCNQSEGTRRCHKSVWK